MIDPDREKMTDVLCSVGESIPWFLILSSLQGRDSHCTRTGVWTIRGDSKSAFHDPTTRRQP